MRSLLLLALAAAAVGAVPTPRAASPLTQALVDEINAKGAWKAQLNARFAGMSEAEIRGMMGTRPLEERPELAATVVQLPPDAAQLAASREPLPAAFDAREHWPECADVISTIADQSACGSCWAVSTASSMADRLCIATKGANKTPVSAIDIASCCANCGYGCNGGFPESAWSFGVSKGVTSGSGHANNTGCKPYPFAECAHHAPKSKLPACPSTIYETPRCARECQSDYTTHAYAEDKIHFKDVRRFAYDVETIQREILTNGPVVFTFTVYADFLAYSDGVYEHTSGGSLGGHAVRAIGWGSENGKDYWLIANSWNTSFGGLGGYFKIRRGTNDCGIESRITAALADTSRLP